MYLVYLIQYFILVIWLFFSYLIDNDPICVFIISNTLSAKSHRRGEHICLIIDII